MDINTQIIDAFKPLGEITSFSIAPESRVDFIKKNTPSELKAEDLIKHFKKDILINNIVEKIKNADIFYIETNEGVADELYYLFNGKFYHHGDKIWAKYHPFIDYIADIPVTSYITKPSWFVGTRPNYTHQIVDFLPNILYLSENSQEIDYSQYAIVIGKTNSIIDSCLEIPSVEEELFKREIIKLSEIGTTIAIGNWKIRRIRFSSLNYVRFMSTFEAFRLLKRCFQPLKKQSSNTTISSKLRNEKLLYLSRSDNRVKNQYSIQQLLKSKYNADIAKNLERMNFKQKKEMIGEYTDILMPPGSDNINGLCFSNDNVRFYQMVSCQICDILKSPFQSLAGLRYLLPFINKTKLIPCTTVTDEYQGHAGEWSLSELKKHLLM